MMNTDVLSVLQDAYQLEIEGWLFYKDVLNTMKEGPARDVISYLAEQEEKHQSYLQAELQRVQQGHDVDLAGLASLAEGKHAAVLLDAVRSAPEGSQHEASALHTGMLLEENSWRFYHEAGHTSASDAMRSIYATLEEWEKTHLHLLQQAYDLLKERIWAENRFAPF
jgi:rubrerythrin